MSGTRFHLSKENAHRTVSVTALLVALFCTVLGAGGRTWLAASSKAEMFSYALATGLLLLLSVLWQWRLSAVRHGATTPRRKQEEYRRHRWLGLLPAIMLCLHMGRPGTFLSLLMSWLLLTSSLTGLFDHEILKGRGIWAKKGWLVVHLGSAALLLPLAGIHIWAAFAFKGP